MTEWCWLNGQIILLNDAKVSVEDRGFQFADGVYESIRVYNGRPFELDAHLDRLERSCGGIRLPLPIAQSTLHEQIVKLINHSGILEGWVYLQITRGPGPRHHLFPSQANPTVIFYIRQLEPVTEIESRRPYALLSVPDERWNKCWIKSIALLENVLARNAAAEIGADEAIFIHQGHVTEGTSSNLFMVRKNMLVTHPLGPRILAGVTREVLLDCAKSIGIDVVEKPTTLEDARRCDEVFITSSTREIVWVSSWDDLKIGDGSCGPIAHRLHEAYRQRVMRATQG